MVNYPYRERHQGTAQFKDMVITGDLTVSGAFTFGDAAVDKLTINGYISCEGAATDAISISGSTTANAIHISGNQVNGILFDVDAAADNGFKILVDDGITLGTAINIDRTGTTGIATTAISIDTDGTTGIAILAGFTGTTGIALGGTATNQIDITGTATTALNIGTGTFGTGIAIGASTTAGITVGASATGVLVSGTMTTASSRSFRGAITVNNANYTDGYGAIESELNLTGVVAGVTSAMSSWVNMDTVTASNQHIYAQSNGLWSNTGGVLTGGVFVFGLNMDCLLNTNGGAVGATFYPFKCVNNTNVTSAIFLCNDATSDLGEVASISEGTTSYIPLFTDNEGKRYVKCYKGP